MTILGDELVRQCWTHLHAGRPYRALTMAERAQRFYDPPVDSLLAGRLSLIIGMALSAIGRPDAAQRHLADASWSIEHALDRNVRPEGPQTARVATTRETSMATVTSTPNTS